MSVKWHHKSDVIATCMYYGGCA